MFLGKVELEEEVDAIKMEAAHLLQFNLHLSCQQVLVMTKTMGYLQIGTKL